jgi:oligopeptide/dipeptide ABC transporter ATP-binding protein
LENILVLKDVKTYFYTYRGVVHAVDGVNLEINKAEVVGLVGETGSGKSVTALTIARLVPEPGRIVAGEVLFKGEDLVEKTETEMQSIRGREISMIFQDPMTSLDPVFKVGDQISETILLDELDKNDSIHKAVELLALVGMPTPVKRADSFPHELSGGMRQRVMIAVALSRNPSLLIADEPTTALDVTVQAQILDLLRELRVKTGVSILLISHNLGVIFEMCDRVGVMYAGEIVEFASKKALFDEPQHPYTHGLMNSIPRIDVEKTRLEVIPGVVADLVNPPTGCRFHPRCKHATAVCRRERPRLVDVGKGQLVACHVLPFARDTTVDKK